MYRVVESNKREKERFISVLTYFSNILNFIMCYFYSFVLPLYYILTIATFRNRLAS